MVLAVLEDLVVGHVENDEGVGKDAFSLHRQPLHPRSGEARQDEALPLFLDALDLLLDQPDDDLVLDDRVVLEVRLDLLSQLLLLRNLLLEEIAD